MDAEREAKLPSYVSGLQIRRNKTESLTQIYQLTNSLS